LLSSVPSQSAPLHVALKEASNVGKQSLQWQASTHYSLCLH